MTGSESGKRALFTIIFKVWVNGKNGMNAVSHVVQARLLKIKNVSSKAIDYKL